VPDFIASTDPHQLQQGFWFGAQAGEMGLPLERGVNSKLAADDDYCDPAAAGPGLGDEVRSLFDLEGPGCVAAVTVL